VQGAPDGAAAPGRRVLGLLLPRLHRLRGAYLKRGIPKF